MELLPVFVYIGIMPAARNHAFRERQSLALNSAVAGRLAAQPAQVMARAAQTLARWKTIPGTWCVDLAKWEEIVSRADAAEIHQLLTGPDENCIRLRQSSPFSVQLDPKTRLKILRESSAA